MANIEERIQALEKIDMSINNHTLPGTQLVRCFFEENEGIMWSLSIGHIALPKTFFVGKTIEECVRQAEKVFTEKIHKL
jgi:hypothetical protein